MRAKLAVGEIRSLLGRYPQLSERIADVGRAAADRRTHGRVRGIA